MVEQVGFLIAGEGTLEAVVFKGLAGGTRDVMGFLGLPIFSRSAHNCEQGPCESEISRSGPMAGLLFWEMVESSWKKVGSQYL